MQQVNQSRLFVASCLALVTTAFAFAIRAGILNELSASLNLSDTKLGYINQMAILGFPVATIVGGWLYNQLGPRRMIWLAFASHLIGIVSTIFANSFEVLLLSNFFIGFGNGTVEAACNPLVAAMFPNNKTVMLNRFHVWFPGGIFLGSLISTALSGLGFGWQVQVAVMLIPMFIYGVLFWNQPFPRAEDAGQRSTASNLRGMLNPLYIFLLFCMILTANTELSTQQWVERLLGNAGAAPMLVLAMVTGLMALGRFFAGPVVHRLNPIGVLWASSAIAAIGIYMLSIATGPMVYFAALLFAVGVCYFWPTMLGVTSEYVPQSGAVGMSIMGGIGMFAVSIAQPVVGRWLDNEHAAALQRGLSPDEANLAAGQATLDNLALFPVILIFAFGALWFYLRNRHKSEAGVAVEGAKG
jgi:putative MFS transporter